MGQIQDDHGIIGIESRRESFIIHAGYGYGPAHAQLRNVEPGACYRENLDGAPMQVVGQMIGYALVKPAKATVEGEGDRRPLDFHVIPVGGPPAYEPLDQDFDDTAPLARQWSQNPHPEFAYEDLPDLIDALIAEADRQNVTLKRAIGVPL